MFPIFFEFMPKMYTMA